MSAVSKSLLILISLAVLSGCEGSRLGATLEQNLEPDPQLDASTATTGTGTEVDPNAETPTAPEPGQAAFVGPVVSDSTPDNSENTSTDTSASPQSDSFTDLDEAPAELQPYLTDLIKLDVLQIRPAPEPDTDTVASTPQTRPAVDQSKFQPNQTATRREFARWLFDVNNRIYADERDKKIRAGVGSTVPVFKDVSPSDPDFAAIQGLSEAGIIPSALSGNATAVNFRPDAPLTRSDLILWKVPLDTRTTLPNATVEAVQEAWGFQDAAKIPALSLQAVLADYQLGEFANLRRALGYTTLFQPERGVTRAEAASVLWRFGSVTEGITAAELLSSESQETSAE